MSLNFPAISDVTKSYLSANTQEQVSDFFKNVELFNKYRARVETINRYTTKDKYIAVLETIVTVGLFIGALFLIHRIAFQYKNTKAGNSIQWFTGGMCLTAISSGIGALYAYQWGGEEGCERWSRALYPLAPFQAVCTPFIPMIYAFEPASRYDTLIKELIVKFENDKEKLKSIVSACLEKAQKTKEEMNNLNFLAVGNGYKQQYDKTILELTSLQKALS